MESYGNYLYLLHESTCVLTFMEETQFHRKRQLNYGLTISRSENPANPYVSCNWCARFDNHCRRGGHHLHSQEVSNSGVLFHCIAQCWESSTEASEN